MEPDEKFSLGGEDITAQSVYDTLTSKRQAVVDMGRLMASVTIPSLFPPEGYSTGDDLPGNNQSVGAMCVNTLASKLLLMAFPPGLPFMSLDAKEERFKAEIDADPELWSKLSLALSRLEETHRRGIKASPLATAYVGFMKQLLISGNCLWKHIRFATPSYFLPDSYVVKRTTAFEPLLVIHKETRSLMALDRDHVEFIRSHVDDDRFRDVPLWEQSVDIYSVNRVHTDDNGEHSWCYWEEWEGHHLPDTEVETDYDKPVMYPGYLIPMFGQDWAQGYCEQYRGDLFSLEAHASAGNDLSAIAALALLFVRPGSQTSIKHVREAKNLSVLPGAAEDITVFRSDKGSDASITSTQLEVIARRLSSAFLLQASIQRTGERVTAEEINRLGSELDKGMGGLYTAVAQGNQKIIVTRAVALHVEENPAIPKMPEGDVEITITTGTDAMGQSNEGENLKDFAGTFQQLFPRTGEEALNPSDFARRLAATRGIKPDGLVRTEDEIAAGQQQKQQQAMLQEAISKGVGPAVKGMADSANQQQQLPQAPTEGA